MNELTKLAILLAKADIPFEIRAWDCADTPTLQICSPSIHDCKVDAVSHQFSYGGTEGLIEVLGSTNPECPNEDVAGWLTAEEAIRFFGK